MEIDYHYDHFYDDDADDAIHGLVPFHVHVHVLVDADYYYYYYDDDDDEFVAVFCDEVIVAFANQYDLKPFLALIAQSMFLVILFAAISETIYAAMLVLG